jgi:hypothetical protein
LPILHSSITLPPSPGATILYGRLQNDLNVLKHQYHPPGKQKEAGPKVTRKIATAFADYLQRVFTPHSISQPTDASISTFLDAPCQLSLPIKPFSSTEVKTAIAHINARKAPRYDLITGKVLQELPKKAVHLLTTFYNSALRLAYFPLLWKFAHIIMIPKPGKPIHDTASYRPISLLPSHSKVFEKLLLKRRHSDVDIPALIPHQQFGFRAGHSTIQQSHRIVHEIAKDLEDKTLCTVVFLDVAQAFDKAWHTGLLYKLKTALPTHIIYSCSRISVHDTMRSNTTTRTPPVTRYSPASRREAF